MSFIIVWRNGHKNPHVSENDNGFLETYATYEDAKSAADEINDPKDDWYFDYQIYEEIEQ